MAKHTIVVGNVGNMDYKSKRLAGECFDAYVALSESGTTRAAHEDVTWMIDGEVHKEHIGKISRDEAAREDAAWEGITRGE